MDTHGVDPEVGFGAEHDHPSRLRMNVLAGFLLGKHTVMHTPNTKACKI